MICFGLGLSAQPGQTLIVRVTVDGEAGAVSVRRYGQFEDIPATEFRDIAIDPTADLPLAIRSATPGKQLHSVSLNGKAQAANYDGYYSIDDLHHGDVIAVCVDAPAERIPLSVAYVGDADVSAVESMVIDGMEYGVPPFDFTARVGAGVVMHLNHDDFDIEEVTVNGRGVSPTVPQFAVPQAETVIVAVKARRLPPYKVTVCADAAAVRLFSRKGNVDYTLSAALSGVVEVRRSLGLLAWEPRPGYVIDRVEDGNGHVVSGGELHLQDDCTLRFFTRRQAADRSLWLYVGDFDRGVMHIANEHIDLKTCRGYVAVGYAAAALPIDVAFDGLDYEPALYMDGGLLQREYDGYPQLCGMTDSCSLKVFATPAEMHTVQVVNPDGVPLTIVADRAYSCHGIYFDVAGPTELQLTSPIPFKATANGVAVKDGVVEVTGRTMLRVTKANASVTEVDVEAESDAYDLLGRRTSDSRRGLKIENRKLKM